MVVGCGGRGMMSLLKKKKRSTREFSHITGRKHRGIRLSVHTAYFHEADPRPLHTKSLCKAREIDELTWGALGRLLPYGITAERVTGSSTSSLSSELELNPRVTLSPRNCILTDSQV